MGKTVAEVNFGDTSRCFVLPVSLRNRSVGVRNEWTEFLSEAVLDIQN